MIYCYFCRLSSHNLALHPVMVLCDLRDHLSLFLRLLDSLDFLIRRIVQRDWNLRVCSGDAILLGSVGIGEIFLIRFSLGKKKDL